MQTSKVESKEIRVIYAWNYNAWGGVQIYFLSIVKNLDSRFKPHFILPSVMDPQLSKMLADLGVTYEEIGAEFSGISMSGIWNKILLHFEKLTSEYRFYNFLCRNISENTILHIDFAPWQSFLLIYLLSSKTTVFITLHNPVHTAKKWRKLLWKLKFRVLSRKKNLHFFASNRLTKEWLESYLNDKPAILTYSGINLDEIHRIDKTRDELLSNYGIPSEKFKILSVGQFIDRKGRWDFLEAGRIVLRSRKDVIFVWLTNSQIATTDLEKIKQYGLGGNFILVDNIRNRTDYLGLLNLADIFVLPSHKEGLPIAILEAMALKKPVISTTVDAIPEAIRPMQTGILVEPKKPEELASAILKLLDDASLRNSLAEGALKYVTQKFDMKSICEIIMSSYEESLKSE